MQTRRVYVSMTIHCHVPTYNHGKDLRNRPRLRIQRRNKHQNVEGAWTTETVRAPRDLVSNYLNAHIYNNGSNFVALAKHHNRVALLRRASLIRDVVCLSSAHAANPYNNQGRERDARSITTSEQLSVSQLTVRH